MSTGSYDSDTARKEQLLEDRPRGPPRCAVQGAVGGAAPAAGSSATPTARSPVRSIAWMIQNKAGFIGDAANPAALGGLVGSMFFLGYMLTQYPGGRLGDRFGAPRNDHRLAARGPRVLTVGVRADGRAGRLRRRPRADRSRRGRLLLQRPHPDHQPHPGREADARARHRDRRPVDRSDRRHHRHPDRSSAGGRRWAWAATPGACRSSCSPCSRSSSSLVAFAFFRAKLGGALRLLPPVPAAARVLAPTFVVIVALFLLAESLALAGVAHRHARRGRHRRWSTSRSSCAASSGPAAAPPCSTATSGWSTSPTSRSCGTSGSSASGRCRSSRRRRRAACWSPR